jgi:hypothetical protein
MKYLKTYTKLFERVDPNIISYVKEIFLELEDKGMYPYIEQSDNDKLNIIISYYNFLSTNQTDLFREFELDDDIWNCLYSLESYLESEDYKISKIKIRYKDGDKRNYDSYGNDYAHSLVDLKRMSDTIGYGKKHKLISIYVYFEPETHQLNESSEEEITDYLKNIFLELEDMGFNVDIEKSKSFYNKGRVYSVLIYKSEIPLASSPDKSIRFRIKDALETILTADSYMTGEDYRISHIESQEVFPKNKYLTIAFGVGGYDQSILTNREESNELITLKVEFAKNRINL